MSLMGLGHKFSWTWYVKVLFMLPLVSLVEILPHSLTLTKKLLHNNITQACQSYAHRYLQ